MVVPPVDCFDKSTVTFRTTLWGYTLLAVDQLVGHMRVDRQLTPANGY